MEIPTLQETGNKNCNYSIKTQKLVLRQSINNNFFTFRLTHELSETLDYFKIIFYLLFNTRIKPSSCEDGELTEINGQRNARNK